MSTAPAACISKINIIYYNAITRSKINAVYFAISKWDEGVSPSWYYPYIS